MPVEFDVIEDAFIFVSSDHPYMNSALVNSETGEVFYQSELSGLDEFPEDCEDEIYIEIPHKTDLDLGKQLVFDFMAEYMPEQMDYVYDIFRSRGAYSRFKSFLESKGMLEKWYEYEDLKTKTALRNWCK